MSDFSAANRYLRKAKKQLLQEKMMQLVAQPVFLLCALVLSYGILTTLSNPLVQGFLPKIPVLPRLWELFSLHVLLPEYSLPQAIAVSLASCWLLSVAAALPLYLLVSLCYWPRGLKMPQDASAQLQASYRHAALRQLKQAAEQKVQNPASACNFLYAIVSVAGMLVFLIYAMNDAQRDAQGTRVGWVLLAAGIVLSLAYRFVSLPVTLLCRLMCFRRYPRALQADADEAAPEERESQNPATKG